MSNDRLYFLLKFAAKEDSLRVLREKLNYLEDIEVTAIIELFKNLGDSLTAKIVGRLMGEIFRNPETVNFEYVQKIIEQQKVSGKDKSIEKQKESEAINKFDNYLKDLLKNNSEESSIREFSVKLGIKLYKLILGILQSNPRVSLSEFSDKMNEIKALPVKYQEWLTSRFGIDAKAKDAHPLGDCLPILQEYSEKEEGIFTKYTNDETFKNSVVNIFRDKSPRDIILFSSDELLNIIDLYLADTLTIGATERKKLLTLPVEDKIGQVGDWEVWAPSSQQNSCAIARVDPKTLDPLTTWCTARTKSQNLFYNYNDGTRMLFYVIKKNPVSDNDWLSVGFNDGQPVFRGSGTESVNRANQGLTPNSLREILGNSYDDIMNMMTEENVKLNGSSPAYKKIIEAANDIKTYHDFIKDKSDEDLALIKRVAAENTTSQEVLEELLNQADDNILHLIIENTNKNNKFENIQKKILQSNPDNISIKEKIARSSSIQDVLMELAENDLNYIRCEVATNINANEKILELLANDKDDYVKINLVKNPNITENIEKILIESRYDSYSFHKRVMFTLARTSKNKNILLKLLEIATGGTTLSLAGVMECMAENKSIVNHEDIQERILAQKFKSSWNEDVENDIKIKIARITKNQEILLNLINSKDEKIKIAISENQNINDEVRLALFESIKEFPGIMLEIVKNTIDKKLIYLILQSAKDDYLGNQIKTEIIDHPYSDENIEKFLIQDKSDKNSYIRYEILLRTTNSNILNELANDPDPVIQEKAKEKIIKLKEENKIAKILYIANLFYKTACNLVNN